MITTLQPIVVVMTGEPNLCPTPPPIQTTTLVNDGGQGFGDLVLGNYYVAYKSETPLTDIIGNFSADNVNWYPTLQATDPPTHFDFVQKYFSTDCAFYPAIDNYNGTFGMAWIESMPSGRVDLRYISDYPGGTLPTPPPTLPGSGGGIPTNGHTFYVYPRIYTVETHEESENIPLSDVTVIDAQNNQFTIELSQMTKRGLEITLPADIRKIRWTQKFRMAGTLHGSLTTIPMQENNFKTVPLPGVTVNLYHGRTNLLAGHVLTDEHGFFQFNVSVAEYTIEVETQTLSINVNERIV